MLRSRSKVVVLRVSCALMLLVAGCRPSQEALVVASLRDHGLRVAHSNNLWNVTVDFSLPVVNPNRAGGALFKGDYRQNCIGQGTNIVSEGKYEVRRRSSFEDGEQFTIYLYDFSSVYDWDTRVPLAMPKNEDVILNVNRKSLSYLGDGPRFQIQ